MFRPLTSHQPSHERPENLPDDDRLRLDSAHLAHDDLEKLSPPIIGAWSLPPNIEPYYSQ